MHEPKKAEIKAANTYTVSRGPDVGKASIGKTRSSTVHTVDGVKKSMLEDTRAVFLFIKQASGGVFDYYGTIKDLIEIHDCTLSDLIRYGNMVGDLPFFHMLEVNDKNVVIVHAGYIESLDGVETERDYETLDDFYIYARDDAYICGGIEHGIVVAGHTPTTLEEELPFNEGNVYMFYDEELDCTFYDIDCGCASRGRIDGAIFLFRREIYKELNKIMHWLKKISLKIFI